MASGKARPGGSPGAPPAAEAAAAPVVPRPDRARTSAAEALRGYLREQGTAFLRGAAMRGARDGAAEREMRRSARRTAAVLATYGPLTDPAWAEPLRAELDWLAGVLGREWEYAARLEQLSDALHRLSCDDVPPVLAVPRAAAGGAAGAGAARAAALLERQLTLARTRAHSATLEARGSARFHAIADAVAVAASDVPLTPAATGPAGAVLGPLAARAARRVADAAAALPLDRAGLPYNAEAVQASLGPELTADLRDAPWHRLRVLLRLSCYAVEVPGAGGGADAARLAEAAALMRRHHEAAESAAAVAAAARTPRIAPATAYALGVLHADRRHEVEAARFAFSRLWPAPQPEPAAAPRACAR